MLIVPPVKTTATVGTYQSGSAGSEGPGLPTGSVARGEGAARRATFSSPRRSIGAECRRDRVLHMRVGGGPRDARFGSRRRTLATPDTSTPIATISITVAVPMRSEIGPTTMIGTKLETDTSMNRTP